MGVLGLGLKWAAGKVAGKTVKHTTLRKGVDIKQFISPKKDVIKKVVAEINKESARTLSQAGSGVNIKFKKSGMPHITGKPSMLTRAKGLSKIAAPAAGYKVVAGSLHKDKKK